MKKSSVFKAVKTKRETKSLILIVRDYFQHFQKQRVLKNVENCLCLKLSLEQK